MPRLAYFVDRLRDHASKTIDLAGKAHIAAGLIRGKEIFNLSTNYFHFHHAEAAVLRKPSVLQKEARRNQAKASRSDRNPS